MSGTAGPVRPGDAAGRDLGVYVHVPFCKHACPYCDFYKIEMRERRARERLDFPYLVAREHRLSVGADRAISARPLASIYFGGGTPSVLSPAGVDGLVRSILQLHPASSPEVTLEANPENLTPARCDAWRGAGITRLSIGAQSFAASDLERLERLHEPETIPSAVRNARAAGFQNISLDLMFGLPGQELGDWLGNLAAALALEPEHLSFYGLTIHEGTSFSEQFDRGELPLPGEDVQAEMYLQGARMLEEAGFEHYEISNFARPGFRSIHNQRYWRAQDVVGLGPGAHSSVGERRWRNPDSLDAWRDSIAAGRLAATEPEVLGEEACTEEEVFRRMRRREGFDAAGGGAADRAFSRWLESPPGCEALRRGWVTREGGRLRLSRDGWLVSDSILLSVVAAAAR